MISLAGLGKVCLLDQQVFVYSLYTLQLGTLLQACSTAI